MLILDRASENKLEELVLVSRKLNGVLRENYPGVHKIEPPCCGVQLMMRSKKDRSRSTRFSLQKTERSR